MPSVDGNQPMVYRLRQRCEYNEATEELSPRRESGCRCGVSSTGVAVVLSLAEIRFRGPLIHGLADWELARASGTAIAVATTPAIRTTRLVSSDLIVPVPLPFWV